MTQTATTSELRLIARDAEDLAIVSANLQDALTLVADMAFDPQAGRFTLYACRFDWLKATTGPLERCRTGLYFEGVEKASCAGFSRGDKARILNLLSVVFLEGGEGGGVVELTFSDGCGVRLKVSRLDAKLCDRGERWPARVRPGHACAEEGDAQG